jgi:phosphatidylserine decarboxylase
MTRCQWPAIRHQYIKRHSQEIQTEQLYGDRLVSFLYADLWENGPALYSLLTSAWASRLLGFLTYDSLLASKPTELRAFLRARGVDLTECLDPPARLDSARKLFERRIRYWDCRPMPDAPTAVVSPADARILVGSLCETSALYVKGKFFDLEDLLGRDRGEWLRSFDGGEFATLRLTPDKYHYNHLPVAGRVADIYEIPGGYHSCNPGAVVTVVTPYSKNRRVVTILDTDVPGGSGVGRVAMIEVAALMIGDVVQCYSDDRYLAPRPIVRGMFLRRGAPKSLFRPGGSTDVLLFEPGRILFAPDIVANLSRPGIESRFSRGFGRPLVETDVLVRSLVATGAARR